MTMSPIRAAMSVQFSWLIEGVRINLRCNTFLSAVALLAARGIRKKASNVFPSPIEPLEGREISREGVGTLRH